MHSDDEALFFDRTGKATIVTLSVGTSRLMEVHYRGRTAGGHMTTLKKMIPLEHGDLLVMTGHTQSRSRHGINRKPGETGMRVSISLREILCHCPGCPKRFENTRGEEKAAEGTRHEGETNAEASSSESDDIDPFGREGDADSNRSNEGSEIGERSPFDELEAFGSEGSEGGEDAVALTRKDGMLAARIGKTPEEEDKTKILVVSTSRPEHVSKPEEGRVEDHDSIPKAPTDENVGGHTNAVPVSSAGDVAAMKADHAFAKTRKVRAVTLGTLITGKGLRLSDRSPVQFEFGDQAKMLSWSIMCRMQVPPSAVCRTTDSTSVRRRRRHTPRG